MTQQISRSNDEVEAALHVRGIGESSPAEGIAAKIPNNTKLREVLRAVEPKNRREAYRQLKPYLKFQPLPFLFLVK